MSPEAQALPYRDCVGIVLINRDGLVFTGRRRDTRMEAWQMPQGGIDPGESPQDCALRELKEEIGTDRVKLLARTDGWLYYDLPDHLVGKVWGGRYRGQRQIWFAAGLQGGDELIDIQTEEPEFDAWRWTPKDRLLEDIVAFKRDVYAKVLAELGHHIRPEPEGAARRWP